MLANTRKFASSNEHLHQGAPLMNRSDEVYFSAGHADTKRRKSVSGMRAKGNQAEQVFDATKSIVED